MLIEKFGQYFEMTHHAAAQFGQFLISDGQEEIGITASFDNLF